ncbi:hypothetical protein COV17_01305 [Candidatus Woesearchaeota archaeon CG10_big_fil_rev_8_21_14_0_10_36_11]|nr:MAG: hypothetical protein COV17_01305 [Candidatus Woesearchaeota archaeon CG10_big_fil_rev_8_21_14_0_10_36_11]
MYTKTDANIEIHVHPFLGNNTILEVISAMKRTGIDIASLETLDSTLFPSVVKQVQKNYSAIVVDGSGIILPNGIVLLNGREYNTKEGFHLITVGYSVDKANLQSEMRYVIDNALKHDALVVLDHPFVDNHKTKTAGHISLEMEYDLEKLCKEYSGHITLEWNGYCKPWMRRVLQTVLKGVGHKTLYYDVNKRADEFSARLKEEGFNVPVVADTDLHARNSRLLRAIGTARLITSVEGETASDIVHSMKANIFGGNYQNVKEYVSMWHLLQAFCFPVLFPNTFEKPRS